MADEPTTALDVSIQAQIIQLLKSICRERGAAVMLITHDMGVIAETCDRVAVMYAGRIAEIGPVHEVINQPAHPYTAGLMAAIPDMTVDRERLHQIDGAMPRLNAIPTGCAYNPRCPRAFDRCLVERPDLLDAGATRAACWLHDDQRTRRAVADQPRGSPHDPYTRCDERPRRGRCWCSVLAARRLAPWARDAPRPGGTAQRHARQRWPLVQARDLAKTFDVSPPWLNRVLERKPRLLLHAVDGVSFDIERGKTLALVGESGCGKSTVARLLVGLYGPRAAACSSTGRTRMPRSRPPPAASCAAASR